MGIPDDILIASNNIMGPYTGTFDLGRRMVYGT